jgi:hypothetical protein
MVDHLPDPKVKVAALQIPGQKKVIETTKW